MSWVRRLSSYHWIFQEKQLRWSWEGPAGHAPGSAELWPPGSRHVLPLWEDLQGHLLRFGLQRWCQQRQRHRMVNWPPLSVTHASLQRIELHKLRVQVFSLHMCICLFAGSKKDAIHVVWEFPDSFFQKETIRNSIFCWWQVLTSSCIYRGKEAQHPPSQLLLPEPCSTTIMASSSQWAVHFLFI